MLKHTILHLLLHVHVEEKTDKDQNHYNKTTLE